MLELKIGEPAWYGTAVYGIFLLVLVALIAEPLHPAWTLIILASATAIVLCDIRSRSVHLQFSTLGVQQDLSLVLRDREENETAVEPAGRQWVTTRMIVFPVRDLDHNRKHLLISRSRNPVDTFRRFTVLCRFGFAVEDSEGHNVTQPSSKEA